MQSAFAFLFGTVLWSSLTVDWSIALFGFGTSCAESECEDDEVSWIQMPIRRSQNGESKEMPSNSIAPEGLGVSGHVPVPHLFFATHHKTGTVLARQLGEAIMKIVADGSWGPVLVRGIGWNKTVTPGELLNPSCNFEGCKQFAQDPCPSADHTGPTLGIFQNIDMPTLKRLDEGRGWSSSLDGHLALHRRWRQLHEE